jgi:exonuclease SbcC
VLDRASRERRQCHEGLSRAEAAERTAWVALDAQRDALAGAALGPPAVARDDVAAAWATLVAWADDQRPLRLATLEEHLAHVAAGGDERDRLVAGLDRVLDDVGLPHRGQPHRDVVVEALARAEQDVRVLEEALSEHERLTVVEIDLARRMDVARTLEQELQANRFERWVLEQVMRELCVTATALLQRLSESAYSLVLDDKRGFMVQDHRNADEARLARTLSGGETFLASLSLALALAEQVAQSGAGGAGRLESIFLDEGFGTLDAETLDVVAAAIEELGASGRMVGLVSHVSELAERVPVRFEVRRGPHSSTVTRVDR